MNLVVKGILFNFNDTNFINFSFKDINEWTIVHSSQWDAIGTPIIDLPEDQHVHIGVPIRRSQKTFLVNNV